MHSAACGYDLAAMRVYKLLTEATHSAGARYPCLELMQCRWYLNWMMSGDHGLERMGGTVQNYWLPDGIPKQAKSKAAGDAKEAAEEEPSEEGSGVDVDVGEEGTAEPEQATAAASAARKIGGTSGLMVTVSLYQLASSWTRPWC